MKSMRKNNLLAILVVFCVGFATSVFATMNDGNNPKVNSLQFSKFQLNNDEGKTKSQNSKGFMENHLYVDLMVGVPRHRTGLLSPFYTGSNWYSLPYFKANIEYGFATMFSIGGYAGYTHYGWKNTAPYTDAQGMQRFADLNDRHSLITTGVRFTWHIWAFLNQKLNLGLGVDGLDLYVAAMTGPTFTIHSDKRLHKTTTTQSVGYYFGPVVGAKYYFIKNIGVFIETGYEKGSWFMGGLTFKL